MFNLWIYQRRSACSARMDHGGSSSATPTEGMVLAAEELVLAKAVATADQAQLPEDNVLPFRGSWEGAPRDGAAHLDRKPRGRPKGRSKS